MAGRGVARPVWVKQAEEARLKEEEQKAAAAKAAFEATFKSHDTNNNNNNNNEGAREEEEEAEEEEEEEEEAAKPIGPVDPAKCTAAGTGVGGGAAGTVASFVVTTRDSEGRRIPHGGHSVKVRIRSAGGGAEQEALIKDHGDGSYTATYAVAKRGDYTVVVDCNGQPISGSPFPVFFSGGGSVVPATTGGAAVGFVNGVSAQQSFPNMAMSGMVGMMPGILPGANGGLVLPALGEVCREYLSGRCVKSDCKLGHPPHNQLMVALSAGSSMGMGMGMGMGTSMGMGMGMGMGVLSQMPMGPSAAAMAAAQTIVAAQALQAHVQSAGEAAGLKSQGDSSTASKETDKLVVLSRTVQVSNISPLLTTDPLRRLFSYCGTVIDFRMVDSEQMLYVQYAKPEEARAALSLNNMEVGGKPLSVEMAKSVPQSMVTTVFNASSSTGQTPPLPMMMQQAVAMQQLQFQQALMMQQAMASQQAASRAATVKSAAEAAAMRAAEISKTLKGDSDNKEEKELTPARKSRSRSRSRSPVRYHHSRRGRSRSLSPIRYRRDNRQRSRSRDRHRHRSRSRDRSNHYRDSRDNYRGYHAIREQERERDRYSRILSRSRSRSPSRSRTRRSPRAFSRSPKYRKESHISREVKREDHRSARHRRRSKSITRDQREGNVENGLQRFPAERRHEIKGGDSLKRDASDVKEDKSKKKTSCEVRREDNKPLRHSRRSKSISKDSREGSFEKESSISPAERRYTYNEVKMEENKSACHFKRSKSVSKDSREDNLENDLSVTPADRKNMLRGGMEEASHSRHSKLISKDLIEHNLEKDLTFSPSKRTGKDEGKGEDYEPAPYYRHSKSTLKDARQASLENLNISSAEVRDTSHELKREDRKSSRHSRCSESKSKDSMEVDLEEELSISLAGGRDKLQQLKGEDCKSARYSKHSESRSEDLREGSFDKDLRFSPSKSRAQKRDKLGEGGTIGTCTVDVKQVEDKVRQHMSVNPIEYLKQSEVEEAAVERSDHEEIWEDECHEVVSKQELIRRETKITEDALVDDSIQENRKVRKDSRTGQKTDAREINEKTNYVREEYGETVDGGDRCKEKKSHSNAMNVGDEVKLTETTRQDNEIEAVDEVDEIEENLLNKNEDKLNDAKEEGTKQKRRHKREKEGDDKKKRKRHKNRHRKEDDGEKTEKRRKKHKHHRSTSISTEISPLDDSERSDKKKKKHKRRRHASYSPESSPSVDVDKYDNSGKNGVSQHKQKHRDGSNSMYRSQSLQV